MVNLPKELCPQAILIDAASTPLFGSDQAYESYPVSFSTVELTLADTGILNETADRLRGKAGLYEFHIGLNGYTKTGLDTCIVFEVVNFEAEDNGQIYSIDLDEEAQAEVRVILDEQVRAYFGLDCAGLLNEAGERMCDVNKQPIRALKMGR